MKKILLLVLSFMLLYTVPAKASDGTVVGTIYSTDILAYVNGQQIDSYNIGGKTVVLVEDLYDWENGARSYGFHWSYDDTSRTLTVFSDGSTGFGSFEAQRGTTGTIVGNVYATDIRVFFNGQEVPGYNIGGRTAVCIEDLGTVDETSPNAPFHYSKYLCNFEWDEANRIVSLNTYICNDFDSFSKYPDYQLKFLLKDDQLSCSFDQMNPYRCTLETDFSEDFRADVFHIKPVYMNGEMVGNMFLDNEGRVFAQLYFVDLHRHTKDLGKLLSYEEAKQYVTDRFEILDTKEDENATTYLAKQGDTYYLLHAMKNGGLVQNGIYDNYTTVELGEVTDPSASDFGQTFVYLYPFAGPHGAVGCHMMYTTGDFDFSYSYDSFQYEALSEYTSACTAVGTADLVIDGQHYDVDAIAAYEYNGQIFVDVDQVTDLLNIGFSFRNGNFIFETDGQAHEVSISFDFAKGEAPAYQEVYHMVTGDILQNGEKTALTVLGGGTLLTNGQTYEKEVSPYVYKGKAYVPFHFFERMYQ